MTDELKTLNDLREHIREKVWDWGIEEGGDKLHYNEIFDEVFFELKAEVVKWVTEDVKDWNKNKLMTVPEFLNRWIKRFNLAEEDLE